ncbi:hypothetical protein G3N57_05635 [Paraburkholderia sp. Se-20369]|nr:hypothetical protein [Paraburkholderia sp. Se-20369]
MNTQVTDATRIAPERMSPLAQEFLGKIGRSGVSDTTFKVALMVVPMLSSESWQMVLLRDVAKHLGISRQEALIAAGELVTIGALERRPSGLAARRLQAFRLRERFQVANRKPSSMPRQPESKAYPSRSLNGTELVGNHA